MEVAPIFCWILLVNSLAILFPVNGENGSLLNMPFKKTWSGSLKIELLKTQNQVRSLIECAAWCQNEWNLNRLCKAFWYHDMEHTCDLYGPAATTPSIGVYVFEFEVRDVFQVVKIKGKVYYVYLSTYYASYFDARVICHKVGGYLLEFDSLDEYEAVKMIGNGQYTFAYVGANDLEHEGTWVTDSDGLPLNTDKWIWRIGEPDGYHSDEDCASIGYNSNAIGDGRCMQTKRFFCEKDIK